MGQKWETLPEDLDEVTEKLRDLKNEERGSALRRPMFAHATLEETLPTILDEGLKPQTADQCKIWGVYPEAQHARILSERGKLEAVCEAREENVFFWDDTYEAIGQAVVSVERHQEGDPAVVIADLEGMEIDVDPEVHDSMEEALAYPSDAVAVITKPVPPERIKCVCKLTEAAKQEYLPKTIGELLRDLEWYEGHKKEMGTVKDTISFELREMDKWRCKCVPSWMGKP